MKAKLYLLTAVIFWGWSFVFSKILLDFVSPVELMGLRFLIGLPVLFVIVKIKKLDLRFPKKDVKKVFIGAAIITIHFLIQLTGLQTTTATNTGWIISITPLIMAVLAVLILKEKLNIKVIIGIIIATFGILMLVSHGNLTSISWLESTGDWLVLISAHTWAFYTLEATIALLVLGVFCLALAFWFWQEGVAALGAAKAGIFLYLEPLATTALAVPYLGEQFGLFTALGGAIVLLGVFIAEKKNH